MDRIPAQRVEASIEGLRPMLDPMAHKVTAALAETRGTTLPLDVHPLPRAGHERERPINAADLARIAPIDDRSRRLDRHVVETVQAGIREIHQPFNRFGHQG